MHRAGPAEIEAAIAGAVRAFETTRKLPSWKRAEVLGAHRGCDRGGSGRLRADDRARGRQAAEGRPRWRRNAPRSPSGSQRRRRSGSTARSCRSTGCPGTTGRSPTCGASRSARSPASRRSTSRSTSSRTRSRPRSPRATRSCCGRRARRRSARSSSRAIILEAGLARGGHRRRPVEHGRRRSARRRRAYQAADLHRQPRRRLGAEEPRRPQARDARARRQRGGRRPLGRRPRLRRRAHRLGRHAYAGQTCISVQRVYAHESLGGFDHDLAPRFDALVVGDPLDETTDVGPVIDDDSAERVERWMRRGDRGGRDGALRAESATGASSSRRCCSSADERLSISCDEVFAPVVALHRYTDPLDAIARAGRARSACRRGCSRTTCGSSTQRLRPDRGRRPDGQRRLRRSGSTTCRTAA